MLSQFLVNARRFAEKPALQLVSESGLEVFSYSETFAAAQRIAEFIHRRSQGKTDPVAILMDYGPHWVITFFGIYLSGRTAVPLDILLSPEELSNLLRHSGAGLVFSDPANRDKLSAVPEGNAQNGPITAESHAAVSLEVIDPAGSGLLARERIKDAAAPAQSLFPAADPLVIIYTSGTTGDPKGVILTEDNFGAEVTALLERVTFGEDDHVLSVLPLHHVLALLTGLMTPLSAGATVTFLATVERSRVLHALKNFGVTVFVCVPQFFYLLHSHIWSEIRKKPGYVQGLVRFLMKWNFSLRQNGMNFGAWFFPGVHAAFGRRFRFFAAGGSYFDPAVICDLAAWGLNLAQAYGLTETTGACTATSLENQQWGSVGWPLKGVELKILEPNQEGHGEIAIRGPIVTRGYYKNEEESRASFKDGWFLSGDLGCRDAHGCCYITGRLKEVIVLSSGKNIYPEELERHYSGHPSIKEVAVVPRMTRAGEEQLQAIVVPDFDYLKSHKIANSMEIIRFEIENLANRLPSHKRVTGLQLRTEPLPRTTTRKLKRRELQAQLEQSERERRQAQSVESPEAASPQLENRVAQEVYQFLSRIGKKPEALDMKSNLELDFGLDSLQRVELFSHLEEMFDGDAPHERAAEIYTLEELVALFDPEKTAERDAAGQVGQSWSRVLAQDEPFAENFLKSRPLSHFMMLLVRLFFRYCIGIPLFRVRVQGKENLPARGPYLICPNHSSYLDGLFFVSFFPQAVFDQVFFLGYSRYFGSGIRKWFARWMHIVPLDADTHLVRALRAGATGLRQGKILCIFPEGERSADGLVKSFKHGTSILAREMKVPIVPAAIAGTFEVMSRHQSRIRLHPVSIVFGPPMDTEPFQSYAELTRALQARVEELFAQAKALL
ncbi:MAG TPA: AMP-binding protein [Acidobacteriota bacterium]